MKMRQVKFVSSNDREAALLSQKELEEAAQKIADKVALLREALREDALVRLSETHQQLNAALAAGEITLREAMQGGRKKRKQLVKAEPDEYELIGCIDGTYGGRWMIAALAENASAVWPDGTAIYVRRGKE
jgi:sarcosine oxidase gamma subunit